MSSKPELAKKLLSRIGYDTRAIDLYTDLLKLNKHTLEILILKYAAKQTTTLPLEGTRAEPHN